VLLAASLLRSLTPGLRRDEGSKVVRRQFFATRLLLSAASAEESPRGSANENEGDQAMSKRTIKKGGKKGGTGSASSPFTIWSANGASFLPDSKSVVNNFYSTGVGTVAGGAQVTVTLYAPVTMLPPNTGFSALLVVNSGRTAPNVNTKAQLVKMSRATGAETTIAAVTCSSSASVHTSVTSFSATFDPDTFFYYVRVTLRSGIAVPQLQVLYGVALQ
jgi:hypothetical protein